MQIAYLPYKQIDTLKWDACVEQSLNGSFYAQSLYLNTVCSWDALVLGDYELILPLPKRKKWGIAYIYTPHLIGQLGIIGRTPITATIVTAFINAIPAAFRYIDLQLNESNAAANTGLRNNYVLSLKEQYEHIRERYSKDAIKNLRRAAAFELQPVENIPVAVVIEMYEQAYGRLNRSFSKEAATISLLFQTAIDHGNGYTIGVKNTSGELIATAFFGIDNNRIYYTLGAPTKKGRECKAIHFLIDDTIRKYAGTDLLLDFEGSDIPSVAEFYQKFGPEKRQYPHIIINCLPWFLKWLKKN